MADDQNPSNADDSQNGGSQDDGGSNDSNGEQSGPEGKDKNALEWVVTGLGAAIVLFVLGYLSYQFLAGPTTPADLVIEVGAPEVQGTTAEIPVTVRNRGSRVAEAAVVEVCAGPESCAQLTFDYVPFESELTGTVGLEAPLTAPLTTRVVSYRDP